MAEFRIIREGQVVECGGRPVVRFRAACRSGGRCACAPGDGTSDVAAVALGLTPDVAVGQRVSVGVSRRALSRVAFLLFGIPLVALLCGAWLGQVLARGQGLDSDAGSAGIGLLALVAALLAVTRRFAAQAHSLDMIVRLQRTDR